MKIKNLSLLLPVTALSLLWIGSYPTVLGVASKPKKMRQPDEGVPGTLPAFQFSPSWVREWEQGRTFIVRTDIGHAAYVVVFWKGSIHLQRRTDTDWIRFDPGTYIGRSLSVMDAMGTGSGSGQELYYERVRFHWLGFALVDYGGGHGVQAVAFPFWLFLLAILFPRIYRFARLKYFRRQTGRFEIVQKVDHTEL